MSSPALVRNDPLEGGMQARAADPVRAADSVQAADPVRAAGQGLSAGEARAVLIEDLSFRYPSTARDAWVLRDLSLTLGQGEMLLLAGPNGGGKSTLLKLMLGQERAQHGQVRVLGLPPAQASPYVGYVPQRGSVDAKVPAVVMDIVLAGCLARSSWGPRYPRTLRRTATAAMAQAGVDDLAQRPYGSLSGGQQQRVLVARALAAEARLLLLDEPTSNLDPAHRESLLALLETLRPQLTIVMVSHGPEWRRTPRQTSPQGLRRMWIDGTATSC